METIPFDFELFKSGLSAISSEGNVIWKFERMGDLGELSDTVYVTSPNSNEKWLSIKQMQRHCKLIVETDSEGCILFDREKWARSLHYALYDCFSETNVVDITSELSRVPQSPMFDVQLLAEPDLEGWIPWKKGAWIGSPDMLVDVKFASGAYAKNKPASSFIFHESYWTSDQDFWKHETASKANNIVAWRPAQLISSTAEVEHVVEPDQEGWIPWKKGKWQGDPSMLVDVKFLDGHIGTRSAPGYFAGGLDWWNHESDDTKDHIIAWRPSMTCREVEEQVPYIEAPKQYKHDGASTWLKEVLAIERDKPYRTSEQ